MRVNRVLLIMLFSLSMLIGAPAYCAEDDLAPGLTVTAANIYPAVIVPVVQPDVDPAMKVPPVGRVVWVKGIFKAISSDHQERSLEQTSIIYLHDTLVTDIDSQAQIVFTDNTLMTFKPGTKFVIEDYSFEPQQENGSVGKYFVNLIEGGFRTITGLIAKNDPSSYQVNTPVATIGVRGTDYIAYFSDGRLDLGYYNGTPCVMAGGAQSCLNADNQYAEVTGPGMVPRIVKTQPPVFKEKPPIVPARIMPSSSPDKFGPVATTGPASTGAGTGTGTSSGSDAAPAAPTATVGAATSDSTVASGGAPSGASSGDAAGSGETSGTSAGDTSSGGTSAGEPGSGGTSSGETSSGTSSSESSSGSQQQVGAAGSDTTFQPDSGSVATMSTDSISFTTEPGTAPDTTSSATTSGTSTGTTSSTTSGTGTDTTSSGTTSGTSTDTSSSTSASTSSEAGSTIIITGTESAGATGGMTITGTEVQVNAPSSPSGGTVSSFCIVQ